MLLTAIEDAGTTESDKVKDALYNVDYPGVTGQTKFDSNGDVDKEFVKVTIEDGKFVKMK
jgi:branched-chain amino acid transport system substrate-binding protein